MNSILVTGGAGFIGSCFVRQMVARQDVRVINLDKLTYASNLDSLASVIDDPLHTFVQGDMGKGPPVLDLFRQHRPWALVNLAAESHVDRSIDSPAAFVETNVVGTFHLLETALRYWKELPGDEAERFRFLHVSTDEVYGSLGPTGAFTETTAYAPNSPYAASKAAADHFVRAYHQTYGLPVLITNCSNNYGPYQFPEKLIPLMILKALEGKLLPVYGDGQNVRDWIFVEDHACALRTVLERGEPGEVYNIGGDCQRTNREVVEAICDAVDRYCPDLPHQPCRKLIRLVEDRPGHDRRYAIDTSKIRRNLDWQPQVAFESGLEQTVHWYLSNSDWLERITAGQYRRERLGLHVGRERE